MTRTAPDLVEALVDGALRNPARGVTVIDGRGAEQFRSYAALVDDARRRAAWLTDQHGLQRDERVLLALPTSHAFISSFLAVAMAGAIPIPVPRPSGLRARADALRLASIASSSRARLLLVDPALTGDALPFAPGVRLVVVDDEAPAARRLDPRPGRVAFVQYTSGSTSEPRGVVVDQAAAVSQMAALAAALEVDDHDVGVCWLPLFHDMGLVGGMLMPMATSMSMVMMSPSTFLHRPARWLRAMSSHKGTISAAPSSAYALAASRVKDDELAGIDLSSWRVALNGAEPIRKDAVDAFCSRFTSAKFAATSMTPAYGLAEATLAVAIGNIGKGARFVDKGCVIGAPLPGCAVSIDEGEIVVEAPFVAAGYLDDATATSATFGTYGEQVLRTGDLGEIRGGRLVVTGRKKDLIIVRGRKITAEDVERVVENVDGARPHSAIAFAAPGNVIDGEGVVVVAAQRERSADDASHARFERSVRDAVGEELGVPVLDVHVVAAGEVPRTTSGKKQRSAAKALWLDAKASAASTTVRERAA